MGLIPGARKEEMQAFTALLSFFWETPFSLKMPSIKLYVAFALWGVKTNTQFTWIIAFFTWTHKEICSLKWTSSASGKTCWSRLLGVKDPSFHASDTTYFRGVPGIYTVGFIKEVSIGGYRGIWQRKPHTLGLIWNYGNWVCTVPDNLQWGSA